MDGLARLSTAYLYPAIDQASESDALCEIMDILHCGIAFCSCSCSYSLFGLLSRPVVWRETFVYILERCVWIGV
jgi:hypothetical protein